MVLSFLRFSYEHAVYVLDAFFYVLKGWPRSQQSDNPESGGDSSIRDDPVKASVDQVSVRNYVLFIRVLCAILIITLRATTKAKLRLVLLRLLIRK